MRITVRDQGLLMMLGGFIGFWPAAAIVKGAKWSGSVGILGLLGNIWGLIFLIVCILMFLVGIALVRGKESKSLKARKEALLVMLGGYVLYWMAYYLIKGPKGIGSIGIIILPGNIWGWLFVIVSVFMVLGGLIIFISGGD